VAILFLGLAWSARPSQANENLESLTLEQLMAIEVTSVSKRPQRVIDTPAAIFVLTRDDIRRSGHTSVPELLRMVPGASVGRLMPKAWSVGIRGDEAQFSRMLLVLVDGRPAYTTSFNGTFWDELEMPLEDIERIEVIRGPGASVWGANAVHGVINIVRRRPEDAPSAYASATVGTEDRLLTSLGHAGAIGDGLRYRVSTRYVNRDGFVTRNDGSDRRDGYRNGMGSFRADLDLGENATLTLQGDGYLGDQSGAASRALDTVGSAIRSFETYGVQGGNALAHYEYRHSEFAATEVQLLLDKRTRDLPVVKDRRTHYDAELRNRFRIGDRHRFNWGVGARHVYERMSSTLNFIATPEQQDEAIYNLYLQDEYAAIESTLHFTLGSKFEWNTYTGWEVQPTARFLWAPFERHQFWGAVSRAVRIPSRSDRGEYLLAPVYTAAGPVAFRGTEDHDSEVVVEYDLGYRLQPTPEINVDLTAFTRRTQNFQAYVPSAAQPLILELRDVAERRSIGAEASIRWQPVDSWNLVLNWTHARIDHSRGRFSLSGRDSTPHHQLGVFSYLELPGNLELDLLFDYHGRFGTNDTPTISSEFYAYTRHDARLAWRPTERIEISLVGQNLLDDRHREGKDYFEAMGATGFFTSEVQRAGFVQLAVSY